MKKKIIGLAMSFVLVASVFAKIDMRASAADLAYNCTVYEGANEGAQGYSNWWADVVNSYLVSCDNNEYMKVQADALNGALVVEYYDSDFTFLRSKTVSLDLPLFGAFYEGEDYYFVLTGAENPEENDERIVFRITQYDKNWNRITGDHLFGANTTIPFDAGSARMVQSGKYLLIHTCHEMYSDGDGLNHQANVTIQYDIEEGRITDYYTKSGSRQFGYVSHSFNQFIRTDGNRLVTVDHGDAYPRSVCLMKYNTDFTTGTFTPESATRCDVVDMLPIAGNIGTNFTGVMVGGFEISETNYIVVGKTLDQQLWETEGVRGVMNIFVSTVPRDLSTAPSTLMLTNYETAPNNPVLVKLSDTSFLIMWEREGMVYYTKLDGTGKPTGETYSFAGSLSDCQPLVKDGKVVWYTWKNESTKFYTIDLENLESHSVKEIIAGHIYEYLSESFMGGMLDVTEKCTKCGEEKTERFIGVTAYDLWTRYNMQSLSSVNQTQVQINDTVDFVAEYNSAVDLRDFVVEVSDETVARVVVNQGEDYTFSMRHYLATVEFIGTGTVDVTIYPKYLAHDGLVTTYTYTCTGQEDGGDNEDEDDKDEDILPGDVTKDGNADALDALAILKYVAGMENEVFESSVGDVNKDNAIDALDALDILKYVAGMISSLG